MIVFENKHYQTNTRYPNDDWTGNALFVVPDGSELANKIMAAVPYYDFVLDEGGNLVDIVETERPEPEPEPVIEEEVDNESMATAIREGVNSI